MGFVSGHDLGRAANDTQWKGFSLGMRQTAAEAAIFKKCGFGTIEVMP